ncbi:MAG: hypothetical protein Q4G69_08795 [Planctomycetia bacterium]|nr:hypothetical protein [Planctomycetia bacterium]
MFESRSFFADLILCVCFLLITLSFLPMSNVRGEAGENSANTQNGTAVNANEDPFGLMRINLSWIAPETGQWSGEISLENGHFSNSIPLGKDPAGATNFFFAEQGRGTIRFQTPYPIMFCGLQTTLHASLSDNLSLLIRNLKTGNEIRQRVPLRDLVQKPVQFPFEETENGILIERCGGDDLPVLIAGAFKPDPNQKTAGYKPFSSMVFSPGETLYVRVAPRLFNIPPGTEIVLAASLHSGNPQKPLWKEARDWNPQTQSIVDLAIPIPEILGPFQLDLALQLKNGARSSFSILPHQQNRKEKDLALRSIQGIIVSSAKVSSNESDGADDIDSLRNGLLETVDPSNPAWWKVFAKKPLFSENRREKKSETLISPDLIRAQQSNLSEKNSDFLKFWKMGGLQVNLNHWRSGTSWGQWEDLWKQSRGSGHLRPYKTKDPSQESFVELIPDPNPDIIPWESYTIPVREPGKPHILEIEYLSHVPQSLGISIIEPSVSGGIFPKSIDSGFIVRENPLCDLMPNRVLRHQILFWPKTKSPCILIMNRDTKTSAVFGRIRMYRAKDQVNIVPRQRGARRFASFMARPSLCDQFSAVRAESPIGVLGSEDWNTFYQAADRTAFHLKTCRSDTLLLGSVADGSALYPSRYLNPTPVFDSGIFLQNGKDPIRKDVLEFMAKTFDREGLSLIPCIDFNFRLPRLEEKLFDVVRSGNAEDLRWVEGIRSIGPEGSLYIDRFQDQKGIGPHYNLLHPLVQEAMIEVITELLDRYAAHPSFDGLGIQLSMNGFAQLPDDVYFGMDDLTFGRFIRESGVAEKFKDKKEVSLAQVLSAAGTARYRLRAEFIRDHCRESWIQWRGEAAAKFYSRAADLITARRPELSLYLVGSKILDGDLSRLHLYPSLTKRPQVRQALREIGMDPDLYANSKSVVFLRPGSLNDLAPLHRRIVDFELESPSAIELFSKDKFRNGAIFFHHSEPKNLPSFDQKSPYRPTLTQIAALPLPSDFENRKRFANQLACMDTLAFFDGGEMLPTGQEMSMKEWIEVFHSLPAIPFENFSSAGKGKENEERNDQPIIIRHLKTDRAHWFYMVNNAPFHTGIKLSMKFKPGTRFFKFTGGRKTDEPHTEFDSLLWTVSLRPYDLIAFVVDDPNVILADPVILRSEEICGPNGRLNQAVQNYIDRILIARLGVPSIMENASFEVPSPGFAVSAKDPKEKGFLELPKFNLLKSPFAKKEETNQPESKRESGPMFDSIPGWRPFGDKNFEVSLNDAVFKDGRKSLKLTSRGGAGGVISAPLPMPKTGRICLQAAIGVPGEQNTLSLRVCLTGKYRNAPYLREVHIGKNVLDRIGQNRRKENITAKDQKVFWTEEVILFERLPFEGLEDLSVRFDLLDTGTVWIDQIRIYKIAFADAEQKDLMRLIQTAEYRAEKNRVCDSLSLLDSWWAQLLRNEIPDNSSLLANRPVRPNIPELPKENNAPPEEEKKNFFKKIFSW